MNIVALKAANARRWQDMHTDTALNALLDRVARHLVESIAKARYQEVSAQTHVPWWVIAVIHERESSQSWTASLAQGDPWNRVSIHVPRGRGPFSSWMAAAIDALEHAPPFAARWSDWSVGGTLTLLEEYNGLGYAAMGIPSPYVWASSDQYHRGKYIADGHFDPNAVDHQLGCAALLSRMALQDVSIKIGATTLGGPAETQTMPFMKLTSPDGKTVYVNPEQVMMVRPAMAGAEAPNANSDLVLVNGTYAVHESVEEVMTLLGATQ